MLMSVVGMCSGDGVVGMCSADECGGHVQCR